MFFENGKCAKVPLRASFETKTRRKKLANAYTRRLAASIHDAYRRRLRADAKLGERRQGHDIQNTVLILPKAARDTQGVQVMRLTRAKLRSAVKYKDGMNKRTQTATGQRPCLLRVRCTTRNVDQLKFV